MERPQQGLADRGDPVAQDLPADLGQGVPDVGGAERRYHTPDQVLGRFQQQPGGGTGRVADNGPSRRVRRSRVDAGGCEREGVGHAHMAAHPADDRRVMRNR